MHEIKTGLITIDTQKRFDVIDITDTVNRILREDCMLCNVFVLHTTCAITTMDIDPGVELDYEEAMQHLMPELEYKHSYNPDHMPYHILSSFIGASISLPVERGNILLGQWQRLVLVELNGPRKRRIAITGVK